MITWPIVVHSGEYVDLHLLVDKPAEIELQDNGDIMLAMPALLASIDNGATFTPLSTAFMKSLANYAGELLLRIDGRHVRIDMTYAVSSISIDGVVVADDAMQAVHSDFYYDSPIRAIDEYMLASAIRSNIHELNNLAQDANGWPIMYYRAELLQNINAINAESLKAIRTAKQVVAFFPHKNMIRQLDFDQFGLEYSELTNLHILPDEFHRVYDDNFARPNRNDIVYIGILDQFFEISDVTEANTPLNTIAYFDCTLKFLTDRQAVAKDDDIISISDMLDGEQIMDSADMLKPSVQPKDKAKTEVKAKHDKLTWRQQTFEYTTERTATLDNACYGICYANDEWLRFKCIDGIATLSELDGSNAKPAELTQAFCKYAEFAKPLTAFNEQMYYTTNTIPRQLSPLALLELQGQI